MGELDARILAGEKVVEGKLPGSWPKVKTAPDTRLTGGETIGSLEVVPTPGHTPGHLVRERRRVQSLLLSLPVRGHGDLGQGQGPRLSPSHPSPEPEPARRRPWACDKLAGGGDRLGDQAGATLRTRRR
jgi:hypothetical protein